MGNFHRFESAPNCRTDLKPFFGSCSGPPREPVSLIRTEAERPSQSREDTLLRGLDEEPVFAIGDDVPWSRATCGNTEETSRESFNQGNSKSFVVTGQDINIAGLQGAAGVRLKTNQLHPVTSTAPRRSLLDFLF